MIGKRTLALLLGMLLVLGVPYALYQAFQVWLWGGLNYSTGAPAEVFQKVVGKPPPPGLTDLRVIGRSYPHGWHQWVWMRFNLTDHALRALVGDDDPAIGADARKLIEMGVSANNRYDAQDQQAVRWQEVGKIERPEVYLIGNSYHHSSFVWSGVLIVDRKKHVAYIKAAGD